MIEEIACVILAGGKSSRMGRDKAQLPFGGKESLLLHQYEKMSGFFKETFISCKSNRVLGFDAPRLIEKDEVFSPLVGIKNAFELTLAPRLFFIGVDTPLVKLSTIERLCRCQVDADVICARSFKTHWLIGVWSRRTHAKLSENLKRKEYKIGKLLAGFRVHSLNFEDEREFINLNAPADYEESLRISEV